METEAPPEGTGEETESQEAGGENAAPDHGDNQTEESQGTEPEDSGKSGDAESKEGKDTPEQ